LETRRNPKETKDAAEPNAQRPKGGCADDIESTEVMPKLPECGIADASKEKGNRPRNRRGEADGKTGPPFETKAERDPKGASFWVP
jgi:hypothetical protein